MTCTPAELDRVQKTQLVRIADVLLIGPLMIIGGHELTKQDRPVAGNLLSFFGLSTMLYNAKNWYVIDRARRGLPYRSKIMPEPIRGLEAIYKPGTGWIYRDDDPRATELKHRCFTERVPKRDCRFKMIRSTRRVVCRRKRF